MSSTINAAYKYQHEDGTRLTGKHFLIMAAAVLTEILLFLFFPPAGFVMVVVWLIVLGIAWPKKKICLYPRYFICGDTIIYYRRVSKLTLMPEQGVLSLTWGNQKSFQLKRDNFPTAARKDFKIAKNKQLKFDKVSGKIIEKIVSANPDVQLVGIEHP
ncbi:MAG: hypothetical protein HYS18_14520 [Burkholderiales bacterium]|nr:hypothetical protein [Burkholderiales bacterium]